MKSFARGGSWPAAQTRPDVVFIADARPGFSRTDIAYMMFDSTCPRNSGSLAGESFAAVFENHRRYPFLRMVRDRALFESAPTLSRTISIRAQKFSAVLASMMSGSQSTVRQR
jgi:hypothetical protein